MFHTNFKTAPPSLAGIAMAKYCQDRSFKVLQRANRASGKFGKPVTTVIVRNPFGKARASHVEMPLHQKPEVQLSLSNRTCKSTVEHLLTFNY